MIIPGHCFRAACFASLVSACGFANGAKARVKVEINGQTTTPEAATPACELKS